ncbi:MAG: carboxypeptidase-like regulatory domain-containing protein [Terriglobia bacterium]
MRLAKHLCLNMVFLCALPIAALAQMGGAIDGTVTDQNGGVVPAATVTATNVKTGVMTNVQTSVAGLYAFPLLPPGPYTITVKQAGFKTFIREGIEVRLALSETIDIKLELGTVQQTVEVKGQAPVLTTNNATVGMNMSPQTLDSLPVWFGGSMRLANSFIGYMPNVQTNDQQTFNGSVGRAAEVMIDGGSIVSPESGGISYYFPGMEPYSETKVITSGSTAEYGRTGGGFQFFTTKSGTNDFHGSIFYNFERQIFNANSWSGNQNTTAANFNCFGAVQTYACRPKVRYNDEGGSAGGPVWIPHIYDGRNKTFFFFTWEGYWQPATVAQNTGESVPTAAELQGNFQGVYTATKPVIYDPSTTVGGVRTPFGSAGAYNIIPSSRFSTLSTNFITQGINGAGIAPNSGTGASPVGDYYFNQTTTITDKDWSIKIDHSLGAKSHFSFFETHRFEPSVLVQYLPGPLSNGLTSYTDPHQFRASWDWVATPHVVLHSYWSGDFDNQTWVNPLQNGYGCKLGFSQLPCGTNADATPYVSFTGGPTTYTAWGMNQGKVDNGGQKNHILMEGQDLTWTRNKHEFKMGWTIRRSATLNDDWSGTNGAYTFSNVQTSISAGSTTTGDSFASFLLGDPSTATSSALPIFDANIRYAYTAGYFQDAWKIKPNLTFNLGLRYEVPINWHYVNGTYSAFSPTATNPAAGNLPGAMIFMGIGPGHTGSLRPYPTDFTDVGPRLGFAWQVRPNTVLRGAFGLIYEGEGNGDCGCTDGYGGGKFTEVSPDGLAPAFQWDKNPNGTPGNYPPAGFSGALQVPGVDNFGSGGPVYMGPKWGYAPRIYDMNMTVQHQYKGWLFQVGYQGQRTHNAITGDNLNTVPANYLYLMNTPTALSGTTPGGTAFTIPAGTNLLAKTFTDPTYGPELNGLGFYAPSGVNSKNPTCAGWSTCWTSGATGAALWQSLRAFPQMGEIENTNDGNGWISYDSMVLIVEHRFGDLNLETSYVRSKNLNIDSGMQIFGQYHGVQSNQDPNNRADNKTFANADIPNNVNFTGSYQLPFGRGKKFLNSVNPIVNGFLGGWTLAGLGQYRTGTLIELFSPTNNLGTYMGWQVTKADFTGAPIRNRIPDSSLDPDNPSIRWFNPSTSAAAITTSNPLGVTGSASFVQAPLGTLGNAALYQNQYRQPWYRYEAVSLNKLIGIWGEGRVTLRYTLYVANPFQRTGFGGITSGAYNSSSIGSSNFGRATGPADGARQMSMGLRLYF